MVKSRSFTITVWVGEGGPQVWSYELGKLGFQTTAGRGELDRGVWTSWFPKGIPLLNGSCLCFIFIAKVYAILLKILLFLPILPPVHLPSPILMGSHPPVPHQITLRYWELLLELGKKVFIHKPVTNVLYPKCSGFFCCFCC